MSVVSRPAVNEFAEMEMNLHGKYNEHNNEQFTDLEQYTVRNSNLQEMKLLHQIYVPTPQNDLYHKAKQDIQTLNGLYSQTQQYLPTQESNYMYQQVAQQLYAQNHNQIPQFKQDLYQVQQPPLQDSQYPYNQVTQHLLQTPRQTPLYTSALQSPSIKFNQQLTNTPLPPQASQETYLHQQPFYEQAPLQDSQYPYNQVTQHLVKSPQQPQLCTNTLQKSQSPQQTSLLQQPFYEKTPLQDPYNQVADTQAQLYIPSPQSSSTQWNLQLTNTTQQPQPTSLQQTFSSLQDSQYPYKEVAQHLVQSPHQLQLYTTVPELPSIQENRQLTNIPQRLQSPQQASLQQPFSPLQDSQYPYKEVAQHLVQSPHQQQLYTTVPEPPSIQENRQLTNIPQLIQSPQQASLHQQPFYGYQQNVQYRISESSEDYASSSSPGGKKKQKVRTHFTPNQLETLEKYFYNSEFCALEPTKQTTVKKDLAKELGLPFQVVKNWFQNRRSTTKRQERQRREKEKQLGYGSSPQKRYSVTSAQQNVPESLKNTYRQRQTSGGSTSQESSLSPPDNFGHLTKAINIGYSEESSPEGSSLASPDHRENANSKDQSESYSDKGNLTDTTIVDYILLLDKNLKDERNGFQQGAHLNNCSPPRTVIVLAKENFPPSRTDLDFHKDEKCSKLTNLAIHEENVLQPITSLALGDDLPVPNESLADYKIKYELQEFLKF